MVLLSQRIDYLVLQDLLYFVVLAQIPFVPLSMQESVEHKAKGKHAEQGGVQVARVMMALDSAHVTAHVVAQVVRRRDVFFYDRRRRRTERYRKRRE